MGNYNLNEAFSSSIRLLRQLSPRASSEEYAAELGIGKTSLLNFEQGQGNPTLGTVQTIADHIGCDPRILLGNDGCAELLIAQLLMQCLENGQFLSLDRLQAASHHLIACIQIILEEMLLFSQTQTPVQDAVQSGQTPKGPKGP